MIEPINGTFHNPEGYKVDFELLQEFENILDPIQPENSQIPCRVLGYGEISTVFEIRVDKMSGLAFKRMSIFETMEELDTYLVTYKEYCRILVDEIGIHLPEHGYAGFINNNGRPIFYIIQEKLSAPAIGNNALHTLENQDLLKLFEHVMRESFKVWEFSKRREELEVGIDGQVSNWIINGYDSHQPTLGDNVSLSYIDTSTPFMRVRGVEQMDPELFLRSAPSFLAWILRIFFLDEVVDRYYDFRKVVIDLLANCYKEQKPELIPDLIPLANRFFENEAKHLGLEPIQQKEVQDYYKEDALIWSLYLSMRRFDRFLHRYILRRNYPYLLPGRIKR
jgi:hypothetical protein